MLALRTGWTPDVLAELPVSFHAACHWVIYAQTIVGPDGLPDTSIPAGGWKADPSAVRRIAAVMDARKVLFPDG